MKQAKREFWICGFGRRKEKEGVRKKRKRERERERRQVGLVRSPPKLPD